MQHDVAMKAPQPEMDAAIMADFEGSKNEATYARLRNDYEETNRQVNYLEQALELARTRQKVLASAVDVLDAPASAAAPALR